MVRIINRPKILGSKLGDCDERAGISEPRKSPLEAALARMLEPPGGLRAIAGILGTSPVDLRRLGAAGDHHSGLAARLVRLCNSSVFSLAEPILTLEQATILLGSDFLRTLILAWGILEEVGRSLQTLSLQTFWQHGLAVAQLSGRIASRLRYPVVEAHLAGFLHDVGRVPLLMAVESESGDASALGRLPESPRAEAREFGTDHCELGRRIGIAWRFPDHFIAAFSRHHRLHSQYPELELVRIVSEAETICAGGPSADRPTAVRNTRQVFEGSCSYRSGIDASASLLQLLDFELLKAAEPLSSEFTGALSSNSR